MADPKKGPSEKDGLKFVLEGVLQDIYNNHKTSYYAGPLLRDCQVILDRFESRGLPFLAVDLPNLGKALDSALESGRFVIVPQFKRMGYTALPKLLFVLWSKVFDLDGRLRSQPSMSAIVDLRFLTKAFYKYEADYDKATIVDTVNAFIETDRSLPKELPSRGALWAVLDVARTLIAEVLGDPPEFFIPGHSSGAVATGEKAWEKTVGLTWKTRYRPLGGLSNFYVNYRESYYLNAPVTRAEVLDLVAKMIDVPKDSRGPRLICEEPATNQFLQQGIKDELYQRIEQHPLTKGFVNFTDQTINQWLALLGSSVEPDTVTLDMKEASDRVATVLVRVTFPEAWMELFDACRTEYVLLPNGTRLKINKYAPMGSALCFPIESMVHWALTCAVYMLMGVPSETVFQSVYVYGDDIVLRSLPPGVLFKVFPKFGLKFNEAKSCTKGQFRESCGVDAFKGENISTLKFKKRIPISSGDPECFAAWIEYSNLSFEKGFYQTAKQIQIWLSRWKKFPIVRPNSDVLGYTSQRPYGFRPFLGITKYLTRCSVASAIDDRQSVFRCLVLRPVRPREEQVNDRSRYFETILGLARRGKKSVNDNTPISYAMKYNVKFGKTWSKDVVAY